MLYDASLKFASARGSRQAILTQGRNVLDAEASALALLSQSLDDEFARAVELILVNRGRVVVSGMGKSGHIARKMAATFASTGTPAIFVHPGEAAHGDLGMLLADDLLVMLSNSGATPELRAIQNYATRLGCTIIAITSQRHSPMGKAANACITLPKVSESCPLNISPTTSTTLMLALGDALAIAVMGVRGISREQLEQLHPGGAIGSRLMPINEIMHVGDEVPLVPADLPMRDVLVTMTEKSLGLAGVVDESGRLLGAITDGDLRRGIDQVLTCNASGMMTANPKTIQDGTFVEDALAIMTANKITALFVMDHAAPDRPIGVVHIHDFNRLGLR